MEGMATIKGTNFKDLENESKYNTLDWLQSLD